MIASRTDRALDGRGAATSGREAVVRGGRIEAVAEAGSAPEAAVPDPYGAGRRELAGREREGGRSAMTAAVSATGRAAESLGLGESPDATEPGCDADPIASADDPSADVEALDERASP